MAQNISVMILKSDGSYSLVTVDPYIRLKVKDEYIEVRYENDLFFIKTLNGMKLSPYGGNMICIDAKAEY